MQRNALRAGRDRGFSLVEVVVATAIIGVGVVALMACIGAGTRANGFGKTLTRATLLAQEMREWTLRLPFTDPDAGAEDNPPGPDGAENPLSAVDDLDDLMGVTFCPPKDGMGCDIYDMTEWSETLTLTWRSPTDLKALVADGASNVIHVELKITYQGLPVLTTGWLVAKRE